MSMKVTIRYQVFHRDKMLDKHDAAIEFDTVGKLHDRLDGASKKMRNQIFEDVLSEVASVSFVDDE